MATYNFVTADKFGKNDWPYFWPLWFRIWLFLAAFFGTKFGLLAKSRPGNPGDHPIQLRHGGSSYDSFWL